MSRLSVVVAGATALAMAACGSSRSSMNFSADTTALSKSLAISRDTATHRLSIVVEQPVIVAESADSPSRRVTIAARRIVASEASESSHNFAVASTGVSSASAARTESSRRSTPWPWWPAVSALAAALATAAFLWRRR